MRINSLLERKGLLLIAVALLFSGCAMPKNAEEFRQQIRAAPGFAKIMDTFEVERPFKDVSATLRKKSDECLKVAINWSVQTSGQLNTRSGVDTYIPIFVSSANKAELHIRFKLESVIEVGSPPDGTYHVVLDATPIAKNRTRIDIYASKDRTSLIVKALRGWVQGDNLGCPDLTKK
jgi:hypothetical protein